jgi:hypothetical protein
MNVAPKPLPRPKTPAARANTAVLRSQTQNERKLDAANEQVEDESYGAPQLQARATYIDGAHYATANKSAANRDAREEKPGLDEFTDRLSRRPELEIGKRNKLDRLAVEKVHEQSRSAMYLFLSWL